MYSDIAAIYSKRTKAYTILYNNYYVFITLISILLDKNAIRIALEY